MKSWLSQKLIVTKSCTSWKADCHKSWLSQRLIVTKSWTSWKADCHKSWLSQKLIVTESWMSLKLIVTKADCHKSWLSQKLNCRSWMSGSWMSGSWMSLCHPKFLYPLQSKAFLTFAFITGKSTPYQALLFNKSIHLNIMFRFDLLWHVEVSPTPHFFKCCPPNCPPYPAGILHMLVYTEPERIFWYGRRHDPWSFWLKCKQYPHFKFSVSSRCFSVLLVTMSRWASLDQLFSQIKSHPAWQR